MLACQPNGYQTLHAYYTNVPDEVDTLSSLNGALFGKYQDVVVSYGDKNTVEFSRNSSYLPVWQVNGRAFPFEELVAREGDGNTDRPDVISRYSHVRIIASNQDSALVHWRYFPSFQKVDWDGVVEEYFTFFPNGQVKRQIKLGTPKYQDWLNDNTLSAFQYQLTPNGIELVSGIDELTQPNPDESPQPLSAALPLHFSFDEANGNTAREKLSGQAYPIKGHQGVRKDGIREMALQFDGYYTGIELAEGIALADRESFSISAWVALAAYPFGWAPIVQQADWDDAGFYLGVNEEGLPGFHLQIGEEWLSLMGQNPLELFRWHQLSASYEKGETIRLFINGAEVASSPISNEEIKMATAPLTIGLNHQLMPDQQGRIRIGKYPSLFGIDGLLDEVAIQPGIVSPDDLREQIQAVNPEW